MGMVWRILAPSFHVACALAAAALLVFAAWALVDASFSSFLNLIEIDLGIGPDPGMRPEIMLEAHRDEWARIALLSMLFVVWTFGVAWMSYRFAMGAPADRSLRAMLMGVTLFCFTIGVIVGSGRLHEAGIGLRIKMVLSDLKEDAAVLQTQWPTKSGSLPCLGDYTVEETNPNILRSKGRWNSIREPIGGFIVRLEENGISFDLGNRPDETIEWHQNGQKPSSHHRVIRYKDRSVAFDWRYDVRDIIELSPGWFYVKYQVDRDIKEEETST